MMRRPALAYRRIRGGPGAVALLRVLRQQHAQPAWAIGRALQIPRSTVGASLAASLGI